MVTISNGHDHISFDIIEHFEISENQPWEEYFLRIYGECSFLTFDKRCEAYRSDLEAFYNKLKKCYKNLNGVCDVKSFSYEEDFSLKLTFDKRGGVVVESELKSNENLGNSCKLRFYTDQTYILNTLRDMQTTFHFD